MPASELIRKYFSAYENKDRKAVESLLSNDFVFTGPHDNRIDRETYFKRCWPYGEKSPTYGIENVFKKRNEAFILLRLQNQEWRQLSEHGVLHHRRKQDKRNRDRLWFCPNETDVNNEYGNLRCGQLGRVPDIRLSDSPNGIQERPAFCSTSCGFD